MTALAVVAIFLFVLGLATDSRIAGTPVVMAGVALFTAVLALVAGWFVGLRDSELVGTAALWGAAMIAMPVGRWFRGRCRSSV